MMRRFSSGSSTPGQPLQEALASIDHHQLHAEVALEGDAQQLRLALAHEPVVDVDAGQLVADGPMHQRRGDRGVDAAGERADDVAGPDALADLGHGRLDEVRGRPVLPHAGDPDHEVAQHVPPDRGVDHLGMELDAVEVARRIGQAGERRGVGLGDRPESGRRPQDGVAVAHPDRLHAVDPGEQPVAVGHVDGRRPVLALRRGHDLAAQLVGHQLQPVADAEDRDPSGPERRIGTRRIGVVDR